MELETRIREKPHVSKDEIKEALRDLGVREGHKLMVHSSLSAFGYVEPTDTPADAAIIAAISQDADEEALRRVTHKVGGANTVIFALLECVGDAGVVMMPSFNHGAADVYDPLSTPSSSGIITDVFWRRPGVRRSLHPTHPYAALGPGAEDLLAGNMEATTYGRDNPLGKLIFQGGDILFLGVGLRACTAMHVGESVAGAKCLGYREGLGKVLKEGAVIYVPIDVWRGPGRCLVEGHPLEERLRGRDMIRDGRVGEAELHLVRGMDLVNTVVELCRENCFERCPIWPNYAKELKKLQQELLSLQHRRRLP